jgi:insertion element IS1 protein InsB
VGHKKRKVWRWLAVERARRSVVGWVLGSRGEAPLLQLCNALPRWYHRHCWYFTDQRKAYAKVLPGWQHRPCAKGEGQTNIVEAINCSLRQRCGVLASKSCSFSKSLAMHTSRIKIVIDNYNRNIILN